MEALERFVSMGGYAAFVWPAYGAAFGLLGGLLWDSLRSLNRAEAMLRGLESRSSARRRTRDQSNDPKLPATPAGRS